METVLVNKKEIGLIIISIIALGASVNFLIFGSLNIISFDSYRNFILLPSVVVVAVLVLYGISKKRLFTGRLLSGLWIGAVATLALEAIRIPGYLVFHWLPGDDMIMMPGMFLTQMAPSLMDLMGMMMHSEGNMPIPSSVIISGTLYHFWNGATMGAMYTLVMGKGRWYHGLAWGFIINIGMMLAPWLIMMKGPFGIQYMDGYNIFIIALIAHLAYGAVLGILSQKFVRHGSLLKLARSDPQPGNSATSV